MQKTEGDNYCLIEANNLYAQFYDDILDEELSMQREEDTFKIKYYLEKKIINESKIKISDICSSEDLMSNIVNDIKKSIEKQDNIQGNTIILYGNDDYMFEAVYFEDLVNEKDLNYLNEFCSVINIEMYPILWSCAIIKTTYDKKKISRTLITKKDIYELYINNHYHLGVMININGTMQEVEFTGEEPFKTIGNTFKFGNTTDVIGFSLFHFYENNDKNDINNLASSIVGKKLYGRIFLTLLCPLTNKKYWNLTTNTINNILEVLNDQELVKKISKETCEKNSNPFLLIKKIFN